MRKQTGATQINVTGPYASFINDLLLKLQDPTLKMYSQEKSEKFDRDPYLRIKQRDCRLLIKTYLDGGKNVPLSTAHWLESVFNIYKACLSNGADGQYITQGQGHFANQLFLHMQYVCQYLGNSSASEAKNSEEEISKAVNAAVAQRDRQIQLLMAQVSQWPSLMQQVEKTKDQAISSAVDATKNEAQWTITKLTARSKGLERQLKQATQGVEQLSQKAAGLETENAQLRQQLQDQKNPQKLTTVSSYAALSGNPAPNLFQAAQFVPEQKIDVGAAKLTMQSVYQQSEVGEAQKTLNQSDIKKDYESLSTYLSPGRLILIVCLRFLSRGIALSKIIEKVMLPANTVKQQAYYDKPAVPFKKKGLTQNTTCAQVEWPVFLKRHDLVEPATFNVSDEVLKQFDHVALYLGLELVKPKDAFTQIQSNLSKPVATFLEQLQQNVSLLTTGDYVPGLVFDEKQIAEMTSFGKTASQLLKCDAVADVIRKCSRLRLLPQESTMGEQLTNAKTPLATRLQVISELKIKQKNNLQTLVDVDDEQAPSNTNN